MTASIAAAALALLDITRKSQHYFHAAYHVFHWRVNGLIRRCLGGQQCCSLCSNTPIWELGGGSFMRGMSKINTKPCPTQQSHAMWLLLHVSLTLLLAIHRCITLLNKDALLSGLFNSKSTFWRTRKRLNMKVK